MKVKDYYIEKTENYLSYLYSSFHGDQSFLKSKCYIKKCYQNNDGYLAAVKTGGWKLCYIDDEDQTLEICLAAVSNNSTALFYVADQTEYICRAAVNKNTDSVKYIRDYKLRYKIAREFIL